jgi:SAM-dependent methyltransferase
MPLTDGFIKVSDQKPAEFIRDILIYECKRCGFVQNPVNFSFADYYKDYNYSSGHSEFTKSFFNGYALTMDDLYLKVNGKKANSVIEAGSGDGMQLLAFKNIGYDVLGIEPSDYLVKAANDCGIRTDLKLFDTNLPIQSRFDLCISSYTFDHMPDPLNYLQTAHQVLSDGGLIAVEVHDLEKIIERTEFCLFEHEHTIYMNSCDITNLFESQGFEVLSINPLDDSITRANSLLVVARKTDIKTNPETPLHTGEAFTSLNNRIKKTIFKLDDWVLSLPKESTLIGYGAGGRGIMTLAALANYKRFSSLIDSNYKSNVFLAPKTGLPICSKDDLPEYKNGYCLVFSFGYAKEITKDLLGAGFLEENILLLSDFYV